MKRILIFLSIISLYFPTFVSAKTSTLPKLGKEAYAAIITCGPGNEFYCALGHSALRICDTSQRIDLVFNYGSFDYAEKFFYLKFAKGRLDYFLWPYYYDEFMYEYIFDGRAVWEQRLCLDSVELNKMFAALVENTKKENMYYKYDFFRDNCATRVRDMIDYAIGAENHTGYGVPDKDMSYRDMIYKYTDSTMLWWRFGVDLLLGMRCDHIMSTPEYMYTPMEMMTQYDTIRRSDGSPLVLPATVLLDDDREPLHRSFSPTLFFWLLFTVVVAITIVGHRKGWKLFWLDAILYSTVLLVSLLICYLWFISNHWCTKANLNIIWANPLMLWLLLRLRKPSRVPITLMLLVLIALLACWAWLPQHINIAVIPIVLTLIIRLLYRLLQINRETKSDIKKRSTKK